MRTHQVIDIIRVLFTALELKLAIVARQQAGEADEHLSKRWVDVKVEFVLEVVGAELAEVGLSDSSQ